MCFHVTDKNVLQAFCGWFLALRVGKLFMITIFGKGILNKPTDLWAFFSGHENT